VKGGPAGYQDLLRSVDGTAFAAGATTS